MCVCVCVCVFVLCCVVCVCVCVCVCVMLYLQLERRQLGYQQGGLSHIYDSLYRILRKAQNRTLAGDVDMFAINLHTLFDVTLKFPAVAPNPSKSSFNLTVVCVCVCVVVFQHSCV